MRAYRRGAHLYHDAITGSGGRQLNGLATPEMVAIIAKMIGQNPAEVGAAIAYADPDERVDINDVLHQFAWFRQQGMVKGEFDPAAMIDRRYIIPRP